MKGGAATQSKWSTDPIITVCEATGLQGHSVVETLLHQGKYKVRCLARKTDTPEANALVAQGAEVVKCNPKKRRHLERGFANSYAVFAVTDFFERDLNSDPGLEIAQGVLMAEVAQEVGVHQYIWSSLPNVVELSNGQVDVKHFSAKNAVEQHILSHFEGFVTFVYAGIYCSTWAKYFTPTKGRDGVIEFDGGFDETTEIPIFDVTDTGKIVARIIQKPEKYDQKIIYMASELITVPKMAEAYIRVTGKPARYVHESIDNLHKKGLSSELIEMVRWTNAYGYFHNKTESGVSQTKQSFPDLRTFEDWLRASNWRVEKSEDESSVERLLHSTSLS